jgi:hypothetical protein
MAVWWIGPIFMTVFAIGLSWVILHCSDPETEDNSMNILDKEIPPRIMEGFHLSQVGLWILMIPLTFILGWQDSVPFLVIVSILALVFSELAAWQSSLSERRLDNNDTYGTDEDTSPS